MGWSDGEDVQHDRRGKHPAVALRLDLGQQQEREHRRGADGESTRQPEEPADQRAVLLRTAQDERRHLGQGDQERGRRADRLSVRVRGLARPTAERASTAPTSASVKTRTARAGCRRRSTSIAAGSARRPSAARSPVVARTRPSVSPKSPNSRIPIAITPEPESSAATASSRICLPEITIRGVPSTDSSRTGSLTRGVWRLGVSPDLRAAGRAPVAPATRPLRSGHEPPRARGVSG